MKTVEIFDVKKMLEYSFQHLEMKEKLDRFLE